MKKKLYHKLDARNVGYGHFKYSINARDCYLNQFRNSYERIQLFYEFKSFCNDTFGYSKDIFSWIRDIEYDHNTSSEGVRNGAVSHNKHWAYLHDASRHTIYLLTDDELTIFLLRFK